MKNLFVLLLLSLSALVFSADEMTRDFSVGASPVLELENVSGNISIINSVDGNIGVTAVVHDDRIEVHMEQDGDRVRIKTVYPKTYNIRGGVDFEVTFPANGNLDIESVSGNVEADGIRGNIDLSSVSGRIKATALAGDLNLKSVSGNVVMNEVDAEHVEAKSVSGDVRFSEGTFHGNGSYRFSSTSGDIRLEYDGDSAFTISGKTVSGGIRPGNSGLSVRKAKYGPSSSLDGDVNGGGVRVKVSTVSGSIKLEAN
ncbi:MAG: DUF4097 family beta strand repeat-containing protein [Acidobacteriota bacterium]|nr:DUF4097 family beta strand repeat-containing protein [Acidobacteriota bacterium]